MELDVADSIEENFVALKSAYPTTDDDVIQAWAEIKNHEDTYEEEFGWRDDRVKAYPEITDQLDKLYHDIDDGLLGEDAKTGSWYLAVKEVKDNNPKPSE
jgi:hypothetical protein